MPIGRFGEHRDNAFLHGAFWIEPFQLAINCNLIRERTHPLTNPCGQFHTERLEERHTFGAFQGGSWDAVFGRGIEDALILPWSHKDRVLIEIKRGLAWQDAQKRRRRLAVGLDQADAIVLILPSGWLHLPAQRLGWTRKRLALPINNTALQLARSQQSAHEPG